MSYTFYNEHRRERELRNYINRGLGWNIAYQFELISGSTAYMAFETQDERIHAANRRVKVIGLDNQLIDCRVTTLKNATVGTLGNDITSTTLFNADLNSDNGINLKVYDETTTIIDEGTEASFSSRLRADRRQADQDFIADEYILKQNGVRVLKFENLGDGNVEVEYSSTGYQEEGDERWVMQLQQN